jgi:4'-phosphopantetheinyl transferase EntD
LLQVEEFINSTFIEASKKLKQNLNFSVCSSSYNYDFSLISIDELHFADSFKCNLRREEFILGRMALKRALIASGYLALSLNKLTILKDRQGAPLLPAGYSACLSHKNQIAVAIATSQVVNIGIDLEFYSLASNKDVLKCDKFLAKLASPLEMELLKVSLGSIQVSLPLTCFSIKEAIYKSFKSEDGSLKKYTLTGFYKLVELAENAELFFGTFTCRKINNVKDFYTIITPEFCLNIVKK